MEELLKTFEYLKEFLTKERIQKIEYYAQLSSDYILPVVEDIYQFRNAAAIVRSAEAAGFHKIIALEDQNVFNPNTKVCKGAETWVEIQKMKRNLDSLQKIKEMGYKIVAVSPEKNAKLLPNYQITSPIALVFGTEWKGITDELLDFSDETLAIPMYGHTKSYNVSVAAGICLYDLKQKLLKSDLPFLLNDENRTQLMIRWAVNSIRSGQQIYDQYLQKNSSKTTP